MLIYDVAYLTGQSVGVIRDMPTDEFAGWVAYLKEHAKKHDKPPRL